MKSITEAEFLQLKKTKHELAIRVAELSSLLASSKLPDARRVWINEKIDKEIRLQKINKAIKEFTPNQD
jgi:hypothetical protein